MKTPIPHRSIAALLPLLIATSVIAQVELSADAMRDAEDTLQSLDSNISLHSPKALDEARELARFFEKVEAHYGARADAAQGQGFAQTTRRHAETVVQSIAAGDFDSAQDALAPLTKSCKTCHEVYKKK
jgi:cytochrome c556